jgi:hypothetical protein
MVAGLTSQQTIDAWPEIGPTALPPCGSRYGPRTNDSEQVTYSTCHFFLTLELFLVGEEPLPGYTLEGDAGLGAWLKR